MLSQRQKQHATPQEIEAVRLACRKLIKVGFVGVGVGWFWGWMESGELGIMEGYSNVHGLDA